MRAAACARSFPSEVVKCNLLYFPSLLTCSLHYGKTRESNRIASYQPVVSHWKGIHLSDGVIYQLFIPSFTNPSSTESTFDQLLSYLPYFQLLGVTVLQLFPIEQYVCPSGLDNVNCWSRNNE